jgi:thiamine biosynthesis lipoprotein
MTKKLAALIGLIILVGWSIGCTPKPEWRETTLFVFDTVCNIKLFGTSSQFRVAQKSITAVFLDIQEKFSPDAEDLSSPLVLELFRRSQRVFEDSDGAFDVTVKPLSRLWGFLHGSEYVPTPAQIHEALGRVGMGRVKDEGSRLVLERGMGLDWGGIAKGLAVDKAAQALQALGIARGFINAGGNLFCWGKNPDGAPWKIGVRHPRQEGFLGVLSISDVGAATSGDYQRYFESEGVRYHHIFDPETGYPARGKQSVTVIGPEAMVCDALSTALFVSPDPERILKKYPAYGAIIADEKGLVSIVGKRYAFQLDR